MAVVPLHPHAVQRVPSSASRAQALPPPAPSRWIEPPVIEGAWGEEDWQGGNRWRWLHDAPLGWKARFAAIDAARDHLNLLQPTLHADGPGQALVARLANKARQGVKVNLLFDAEEGWPVHRTASQLLASAGVHLCRRPAAPTARPWRRSAGHAHATLPQWLIADGRHAIVGLLDPATEAPLEGRLRPLRRHQVSLAGPAVASLQRRFIGAWEAASGQRPVLGRYYPSPVARGEDAVALSSGACGTALLRAVQEAQGAVLIAASRWRPTPPLRAALQAAVQRGVELRVLLPLEEGRTSPPAADALRLPGVRLHATPRRRWPGELACVDQRFSLIGALGTSDTPAPFPPLVCAQADAAAALWTQLRADFQRSRSLPDRWSWLPFGRSSG